MKPRGETEEESHVAYGVIVHRPHHKLRRAGNVCLTAAAEDHGGMLRRPLRRPQLINSNRGLINIPAGSSHAQLLMKISTDKSIIMGHFWIGLDDRLLSGWGHRREKNPPTRRDEDKNDICRLWAGSHWLLCQHAISAWHRQGKVAWAGTARGENLNNVDNVSET